MNDIANNIKNLRKAKGLSQEQLAETLHVTRQTVSAWERGVAQPSLDTLGELARALGTEPERLLYGKGERKPVYRAGSFMPVLAVVPAYLFVALWIFPIPMMALLGSNDVVWTLCGQLFLAMLIVGCHCTMKDFIRNREFYEQEEQDEQDKK